MKIKCAMCHKKFAKIMPKVQDRVGSYEDAAFCTLECAARWALIHIAYHEHWCKPQNEWVPEMYSCHICDTKENT